MGRPKARRVPACAFKQAERGVNISTARKGCHRGAEIRINGRSKARPREHQGAHQGREAKHPHRRRSPPVTSDTIAHLPPSHSQTKVFHVSTERLALR